MIKAVIFDLDGVLCQTEEYRINSEYSFLRELGINVSKEELYLTAGGNRIDKETNFNKFFGNQEKYQNLDCKMICSLQSRQSKCAKSKGGFFKWEYRINIVSN